MSKFDKLKPFAELKARGARIRGDKSYPDHVRITVHSTPKGSRILTYLGSQISEKFIKLAGTANRVQMAGRIGFFQGQKVLLHWIAKNGEPGRTARLIPNPDRRGDQPYLVFPLSNEGYSVDWPPKSPLQARHEWWSGGYLAVYLPEVLKIEKLGT